MFESKITKKIERVRSEHYTKSKSIDIVKNANKIKAIDKTKSKLLIDAESNHSDELDKLYLFKFDTLFKEVNLLENPIEIWFYDYLETSDWKSLNNDKWLTNIVLDSCLLCVIKESGLKGVHCLPCQINNISFDKLRLLINNKPTIIFVPILSSNHYTLCVLRFSTKEFVYLNSFSSQDVGKIQYEQFINVLEESERNWQFKETTERDLQKDGNSCGIFVLMYASRIIKGQTLTNLNKPNNFRASMKKLLIKHQGDKTRFCCHCGCLKKIKEEIYICQECNFYICNKCRSKHFDLKTNLCKIVKNKVIPITE